MFWIQVPYFKYMVFEYFPTSVRCLFTVLIVSFAAQKFLILMWSNISSFVLSCAFGVFFKESAFGFTHPLCFLFFFFGAPLRDLSSATRD